MPEGALSSEDIKAYLESIAAEGGVPFAKLFDISEADAALTVADLQALGRSIRQYAIDGYGPLGPPRDARQTREWLVGLRRS